VQPACHTIIIIIIIIIFTIIIIIDIIIASINHNKSKCLDANGRHQTPQPLATSR
jgi:hypothetical protein